MVVSGAVTTKLSSCRHTFAKDVKSVRMFASSPPSKTGPTTETNLSRRAVFWLVSELKYILHLHMTEIHTETHSILILIYSDSLIHSFWLQNLIDFIFADYSYLPGPIILTTTCLDVTKLFSIANTVIQRTLT